MNGLTFRTPHLKAIASLSIGENFCSAAEKVVDE